MLDFFDHVSLEIDSHSDEGTVDEVFRPILDRVKEKFVKECSLGRGILYDFLELILFFTRNTSLAQVLSLVYMDTTVKHGQYDLFSCMTLCLIIANVRYLINLIKYVKLCLDLK